MKTNRILFPRDSRSFSGKRWVNIALRTIHLIGVAGLGGGFLYQSPSEVWLPYSDVKYRVWLWHHVSGYLDQWDLVHSIARYCDSHQTHPTVKRTVSQGLCRLCTDHHNCHIRYHRSCAGRCPILLDFSWAAGRRFIWSGRLKTDSIKGRMRLRGSDILAGLTWNVCWENPLSCFSIGAEAGQIVFRSNRCRDRNKQNFKSVTFGWR